MQFARLFVTLQPEMCTLERFKVDLKALTDDVTVVDYSLGHEYFEAIDAPEVRDGELKTTLTISKTAAFFQLDFHTEGVVRIPCDLCLDEMEQPIATDDRLIAKFGDTPDEDDDVITVSENEGILDVSWLIYEFIALAIPIKHVHAPGKCNAAMTKLLNEHDAARSSEADGETAVDPRWEALKKLKV